MAIPEEFRPIEPLTPKFQIEVDEEFIYKFLVEYTYAEQRDREINEIIEQKISGITATEILMMRDSCKISCRRLAKALSASIDKWLRVME